MPLNLIPGGEPISHVIFSRRVSEVLTYILLIVFHKRKDAV